LPPLNLRRGTCSYEDQVRSRLFDFCFQVANGGIGSGAGSVAGAAYP